MATCLPGNHKETPRRRSVEEPIAAPALCMPLLPSRAPARCQDDDDEVARFDEHVVALDELERRYESSRDLGLSADTVSRAQFEHAKRNQLPTDVDVGHGALHELVAVLRDGTWLHTRAENLLVGDVLSLKEGQCVPADVRLIQCEGMWVDQRVLYGAQRPLDARHATTVSVFDDESAGAARPSYLEASNMAFYGTIVAKGHCRAMVVRTGEDTLLGGIAAKVLQIRKQRLLDKMPSAVATMAVPDSVKRQLDVVCKRDALPVAVHHVATVVVEHDEEVVACTVTAAAFGAQPPVLVELEDALLASEMTTDALEREIALHLITYAERNAGAEVFMAALSACRLRLGQQQQQQGARNELEGYDVHHPDAALDHPQATSDTSGLCESPGIDRMRDEHAIRRFSAHFGDKSPRRVLAKKMRCSTLLHGNVSGCEVHVHFDPEQGVYVVMLQGPALEILSRCGQIRQSASSTGNSNDEGNVVAIESADLERLQAMIHDMEARGQRVISFAEKILSQDEFPACSEFGITSTANLPTSNLCYIGSLGLMEKIHPEVLAMVSFARSADVRLVIAAPRVAKARPVSSIPSLHPSVDQIRASNLVTMQFRDASNGAIINMDASVFPSDSLSDANTLSRWRQLLLEQAVIVLDGCEAKHYSQLIEMLHDMGECVALVAPGSVHAIALASADIGFAVPCDEVVDLGGEAADVLLSSETAPRCDAIRLIELVKRMSRTAITTATMAAKADGASLSLPPQGLVNELQSCDSSAETMANLFRETLGVGRLLGLSDVQLRACFDDALGKLTSGPHAS